MATFDYNRYTAVGIVDNLPANSNSFLHVIGYCEKYSNKIIHYTPEQARAIFTKKGRVFCYSFAHKHPELNGHCIAIGIIPNEKIGEDLDDYVWDWDVDIQDFGAPAVKISPDSLCDDGQKNYDILTKHNLLNPDDDTYIESYGKIFLVREHSNSRMLEYWSFADLEVKCGDDVFMYDGKFYITGRLCEPSGHADITTDAQLIDWFTKKVLKPRWDEFTSNKNYREVENVIKEVLNSVNIDSVIYNSRLKRLQTINTNIALTNEDLKNIAHNPWLSSVLQEAVARFRDNYVSETKMANAKEIAELKAQHEKKLKEEKENYDSKLNEIEKDFDDKKTEFEFQILEKEEALSNTKEALKKVTSEIENKKKEAKKLDESLERINARKSSILSDFEVIKEVLSLTEKNNSQNKKQLQKSVGVSIRDLDNEKQPEPFVQVFMKRLELLLQGSGALDSDAANTTLLLANHHVVIFNDMRSIKSVLLATGKCKYIFEYVTPQWTSFEQVQEHGLDAMVEAAMANPEVMHYVILRNMNLSYIPSYLQPMLDMDLKLDEMLDFPSNLKLLGIINPDPLIPVRRYSLEQIGCSKAINFTGVTKNMDDLKLPAGYLIPSHLEESKNMTVCQSYIDSYITEDE